MYLDTSVVLKLYFPEPDSAGWAKLVDGQEGLCASEIVRTELCSAFLRKEREGALTADERMLRFGRFTRDALAGGIRLHPLTSTILESAETILAACHPTVPLRTLDALHLATAAAAQRWPLLTADARMAEAARLLGMPVVAPP